MRTAATRRRPVRVRTALVAWVVPTITWEIRSVASDTLARTAAMAASMPPVMSADVVTLALARSRSSASRTAASVLVPPTSMPSRRSGRAGTVASRGDVGEVVAERRRPGHGQALGRPPHRIDGEGDDADLLAVAEPLGDDGFAAVHVEDGDDVGDAGPHGAVLDGDQVLVLDLQPDEAVLGLGVVDHGRAVHEPSAGGALDVDDLAPDELDPVDGGHDGGHRIGLGPQHGRPE